MDLFDLSLPALEELGLVPPPPSSSPPPTSPTTTSSPKPKPLPPQTPLSLGLSPLSNTPTLAATMVLKLYGMALATCTKRVRVVLEELGVPYELVVVDMLKDEHKAATHLVHQPFGQVPYIDDDGFVLFESRAIGRYLVAKYAQGDKKKLMPTAADDLARYALFEQAASVETSDFDVYMNALSWEVIFKRYVNWPSHPETRVGLTCEPGTRVY